MSLRRGESTTLVVEVEGLQGLPEDEPVSLMLVNETPRIVRMEGGDRQVLVIGSGEVDARGAHRRSITLTGVQPGSFSISTRVLAGVPRVLATIPPGFRRDPDNEDRVIPDDSELDPDEDEIGPLRFREDGLESPQFPGVPSNTARWQHREEPEKHELSDDTTAWWQKVHVQSYNRTGSDGVSRLTRGGEMLLHLKYSGDCEDGRWIQLIRSTTYVGDSPENLKLANLTDGRYLPKDPQPNPLESGKDAWAVDTNAAGRAAKNPDYPHQDKGEMYDSPDRGLGDIRGYYSDDNRPNRTWAVVIVEEVEFLTFFVAADGTICETLKWGFKVMWKKPNANETNLAKVEVSTTFTDPARVDPQSEAGQAAARTYRETIEAFTR